jgi:hypothetical protein
MSWVWEHAKEVKGRELLVLLALADSANDDGVCWPGLTSIARKTRIDRRHTIRIVRSLQERGYIKIEYRKDNDNPEKNLTNIYRVVTKQQVVTPEPLPSDTETTTPSDTETMRVVTSEPPKPSINRNKEPSKKQEIPFAPPASSFSPAETAAAIHSFGNHTKQLAERLYQQVTGQMSIPSGIREQALHDLETVLDYYKQDPVAAAPAGKVIFARWCSTKTKGNKPYSPTNPAWLNWWLEELAPKPAQTGDVDPSKMTDAEYMEYTMRRAKELGIEV